MRTVVLLVLLFSSCKAFAQKEVDSILADNTDPIRFFIAWNSAKLRGYDSAKAISTLNQLEAAASKRGNHFAEAAALFYKGQYIAIKLNGDEEGILFMKRGIEVAQAYGQKEQWATFTHHMGYYYFFRKAYSTALMHMLRANETFREVGYDRVFYGAKNLSQLAFVYYHLGNYERAITYLMIAKALPVKIPATRIFVFNTLGQSYEKMLRSDSAMHYYILANQAATEQANKSQVGISSGNMGALFLERKEYAKAKALYNIYYSSAIGEKLWMEAAEALTALAEIAVEEKKSAEAIAFLTRAQQLVDSNTLNHSQDVEDFPRILYLYTVYGNAYKSLGALQKALDYKELATAIKDSLERRAMLAGMNTVQQQLDAEQRIHEMKLMEQEKKSASLKRNLLLVVIVLLLIISVLVYSRLLLKNKRDKQLHQKKQDLLQSEKLRALAELSHAESLLNNYTESLRQKTALLSSFERELEDIRSDKELPTNEKIDSLSQLIKASILTPDDWNAFRELFEKVHHGFFDKLKERHPSITPAEVRLLALTKLKLSTAEMAGMLGVSPETIKKTRQRIRKNHDLQAAGSMDSLVEDI
jgi:tetratricopeptide (TPR) repeat protein